MRALDDLVRLAVPLSLLVLLFALPAMFVLLVIGVLLTAR
jgi:hypothetical protein